jgi:hypothetical protein
MNFIPARGLERSKFNAFQMNANMQKPDRACEGV